MQHCLPLIYIVILLMLPMTIHGEDNEKQNKTLYGILINDGKYPITKIYLHKFMNLDGSPARDQESQEINFTGEGSFLFENLTDGIYQISPRQKHRFSAGTVEHPIFFQTLTLHSDVQETSVTLMIPPDGLTISGHVRNEGQPVPDVEVQLDPAIPEKILGFCTYTDEQGNYAIHGLQPGKHYVSIRAHVPFALFMPSVRYTIELKGNMEHDFQYSAGHRLSVKLEYPEGYPDFDINQFSHVILRRNEDKNKPEAIENINYPTRIAQDSVQNHKAEFMGTFVGEYCIEIHRGPWRQSQMLPLALNIDNSKGDLTQIVQLPPPGKLTVEIITDDGKKIDSPVSCSMTPEVFKKQAGPIALPISNNQGSIKFLPSGIYRINLWAEHCGYLFVPEEQSIEIKPRQTTRLQVRAEAITQFEGRIVKADYGERHIAVNLNDSNQLTPDRIVIRGPKDYELIPKIKMAKSAMMNARNKRQSFAAYNAFFLYDPVPGEYTAEISADGYETLTQNFYIEGNIPYQQKKFLLKKALPVRTN